ncbi:YgfZ/GcvT domain-containing protein [Chelatococcus sp. GCM10030263]|uniref:CAF17-like 4Fe-4S cluster assembly/insertion protein YgfZ n=1 Tax=Chelatococcus sp. GCM10030263 TaxID=3273387 RepID=UPI00360B47FE
MPLAYLADRSVLAVSGTDAPAFLQNILTCNVDDLGPGEARLGALLSPQGKILFDGLVVAAPEALGGGFLIDTPRATAADFVKRLTLYKLRSKVVVADRSDDLGIAAGWGEFASPTGALLGYDDPRLAALGRRFIGERAAFASTDSAGEEAYHAHRIALGIPEGGKDFAFGDAFPHEALMDQIDGVAFDKGCYIGQEVVSRMQHRGTARTRIVPVVFADEAPAPGTTVEAGGKPVGHLGSRAGRRALAMLRLDRVADAMAEGTPILAEGRALTLEKPSFVRFPFPGEPLAGQMAQ